MILRFFNLSRFAALLFAGLAFGAAPASAGCGYDGCYAPVAPVVVQPYYYPSCSSCCGGCGSSYYGSFYGAYAYPSYSWGTGCGGCGGYGYGYGYGAGYGYGVGYAGYGVGVDYGVGYGAGYAVGPRVWGPRPYYRRWVGPRRMYARRY
jgi:hypothetical protein